MDDLELEKLIQKKTKELRKILTGKGIISISQIENGFTKVIFENGNCFKIKGVLVDSVGIVPYQKKKTGFLF